MSLNDSLNFSVVLATTIHDMKNSLCMLIQSIESLEMRAVENQSNEQTELARLHYEASRINGTLMQLLALYRVENDSFPLTIEEVFITDLLQDALDANRWWADQRNVALSLDADPDLSWYFDAELVSFLINDVLVNAIRYCDKTIHISARLIDDQLAIRVSDDGEGFPDEIIEMAAEVRPCSMSVTQNRSGLGLYLAKLIARAHCNNSRKGAIILSNQGLLGGSDFVLRLP